MRENGNAQKYEAFSLMIGHSSVQKQAHFLNVAALELINWPNLYY